MRRALVLLLVLLGSVWPLHAQGDNGFSEAAATKLLKQLKGGLEAQNEQQFLGAFDTRLMEGALVFQDQIRAFLGQYDPIRLYFRVTQVSEEGGGGVAIVEFQVEADPRDNSVPPLRRNQELRLTFVQGKRGWKIVDLQPREFFAP